MYKIRRIKSMFLFLGAAISFSACSVREESQKTESIVMDLTYTDTHVTGTICDGVTVDAKLPDFHGIESYDVVLARMAEPDAQAIQSMKKYLFTEEDETRVKEEVCDQGIYKKYPMTRYVLGSETMEKEEKVLISYQGASEKGVCLLNHQAYPYPLLTHDRGITLNEGMDLYPFVQKKNVDLAFMKRSEAMEQVKKQLAQWNIVPVGESEVFALDGENVRRLYEEWSEIGHEEISLEGITPEMLDCYYMIFDTGYQGIPYTFYTKMVEGMYVTGAVTEVHFTTQGIVKLYHCWADYEIEQVLEKHRKCISKEEAFDKVRMYYEEIVQVSDIEISKIYFQYLPVRVGKEEGTYVLAPAWVFQSSSEIQGEETYLDPIFIHAITGELL